MARQTERQYFPDEEPETSCNSEEYYAAFAGLCKFCGQTGHKDKTCPTRPL